MNRGGRPRFRVLPGRLGSLRRPSPGAMARSDGAVAVANSGKRQIEARYASLERQYRMRLRERARERLPHLRLAADAASVLWKAVVLEIADEDARWGFSP